MEVLNGGEGPFPGCCSRDADGLRASEIEYAVEDLDGDRDLGSLGSVGVEAQRGADHLLEAADLSLHQGAQVVLTCSLPAQPPLRGDLLDMAVALGGRASSSWRRAGLPDRGRSGMRRP